MNLNINKSRRMFIKGVALSGAGILLGGTAKASEGFSFPPPLSTQVIPGSAENVHNVDVSPITGRIAFAAGEFQQNTTPDIAHVSLYIQAESEKDEFDNYWQVNKSSSYIDKLRWSPDEKYIAFLASTLDLESKTGDFYLYTVDVSNGSVKKVLLISDIHENKERKIVDVNKNEAFGWFDNNHICLTKKDFSIITVNRNTGEIKTIITPPSGHKIDSLVAIQPGKIRFLRRSFSEKIIEVFEYDGTEIISKGTIPGNYKGPSKLLPGGKYASVLIRTELGNSERIISLDNFEYLKQIPTITKDDSSYHYYMPIAVLNDNQIILTELTEDAETHKFISLRIVTTPI